MGLPVNIDQLIHGKAVEWERLEFKRGWNPEEIVHSMCAFANDLNNWGGGYIIIGIAEINGQPLLPPEGLNPNHLDQIQGEVLKLAYQLLPNYFPLMQPYVLQEMYILVLWCPAGDNRPYTAPSTQGEKAQRYPYIRFGSRSIIAKDDNLRRLNELSARIPFDDRINGLAKIENFDLGLIQAFLQEVKSDLFEESKQLSMADLSRNMLIAKGADENLRPVNVGLLFFSREPEKFFPRCWIELVWHKDNTGRNFSEKYFKGPLHIQLRAVLDFIKNNILEETVTKIQGIAEAKRVWNYPYNAIEESISNAVYHKSYELGSPIEIQIWPDKVEILSYPGPVPPVDAQILKQNERIVARDYRNRRIGDFLKELHLTEGRGTGFPTIYKAMRNNRSPNPIFDTDEQCTYFLTTLPALVSNQVSFTDNSLVFNSIDDVIAYCNEAGNGLSNEVGNRVSNEVSNQVISIVNATIHDKVVIILETVKNYADSNEIFNQLGITNQTKNRKKYLEPLIDNKWIEMTDTKHSPKQQYIISDKGKRLLELLKGDN